MNHLLTLAAFIALCAGWAAFQLWLGRRDAEVAARLNKCGNCSCDKPCDREQTDAEDVQGAPGSA
jgi:hypothetical protein